MRILLLCFFLILSCEKSSNPGAASDPVDLLPLDNDISGFKRSGSAALLSDAASIYEAIDGAAEKYIDLGFVEGVFLKYNNTVSDIDVLVFNHGSLANALRVLDEFKPSSPEVLLSTKNETMMVDHGLINGYSLHYVKENMYIRVDTREKNDFLLNTAKQFCNNIGSKIQSE